MRSAVLALLLCLGFMAAAHAADAKLRVTGEAFVLTMPDGKALGTNDLVGATLDMTTPDGAQVAVRIDSAAPAKERASLMLLTLSTFDGKAWVPFCETDYYGRATGFPVAGAWDGHGRFIADPERWYITCTSGSQGKCILFGYDPWSKGPGGEDLVPYYEACQHMVRADYDGSGASFTKNGTIIDISDDIGIEKAEMDKDPGFHFEAGWAPEGAVCVAKTRWSDLLTRDDLVKRTPRLDGPCTHDTAKARGAILFNGSR
jgi:hypothetical protein